MDETVIGPVRLYELAAAEPATRPDELVCSSCGRRSCFTGGLYCDDAHRAGLCSRAAWEASRRGPR